MKSNYKKLLDIDGLDNYNEFISFAVELLFSTGENIDSKFMGVMYGDKSYEENINNLQTAFIAIMKRLSKLEKLEEIFKNN